MGALLPCRGPCRALLLLLLLLLLLPGGPGRRPLLRPARPAALRPPLPAGFGRVHPC